MGSEVNEASEIPFANGMNNSAFKSLSLSQCGFACGLKIGLSSQILK